jgi:hypothetical protein
MRWGGASIIAATLALTACGSGGSSASGGTTTPSPSPTALPPAGGHFAVTGAVPLGTTVAAALVTCSFPSLNGSEITMQVSTADQSEGGFITLTPSRVFVRIGEGSGSTYTQRNFSGPGVTNFSAAKGAQFDTQLTDDTPAAQNKGTIGAVTAISGSVSCGNKTPGSGTITISGDSSGGAISGAITAMLVSCPAAATYALINGLTQVGSSMASLEIGGGSGEVYFASISTDSANYFFTSSATGLYTLGNGHVIWNNAVLTQSGTAGTAHKITISGNATWGT